MSKRRGVGWKTKELGDMSGTYETDRGEAHLKSLQGSMLYGR